MFAIVSKFYTQLTKGHWQRIVWNLRMLAFSLVHFEEKEVGVYIDFLTRFGGKMCETIMEKRVGKKSEQEKQY